MSSRLLTADEVAMLLQVPRTWVYRAAREGDLPSIQCGRYRRFESTEVMRWIELHRSRVPGGPITSPSSALSSSP